MSSANIKTGGELYLKYVIDGLDGDYAVKRYYMEDIFKRFYHIRNSILKRAVINVYGCFVFPSNSYFVIDSQYHSRYLLLYRLILKLLCKTKTIALVMHLDNYDSRGNNKWYSLLQDKIYFYFTDHIVTISEYVKNEIISLNVNNSKISVIRPGYEKRIPYKHCDKTKKNLLFVGHLIPRKGVLELIDIFASIREPDVILHIVGDAAKDKKYAKRIFSRISEKNLNSRVIIHGRVGEEDLAKLYSCADLFIMPSLKEGFCIVLLEAMSYKLPIVANNIEVLKELVIPGKNGNIADINNKNEFAAAIVQLLNDGNRMKNMGLWGYENILPNYNWEITKKRFKSVVNELL